MIGGALNLSRDISERVQCGRTAARDLCEILSEVPIAAKAGMLGHYEARAKQLSKEAKALTESGAHVDSKERAILGGRRGGIRLPGRGDRAPGGSVPARSGDEDGTVGIFREDGRRCQDRQTARDEDGRLPEDRAQAARQEQEGGREEEPAEDGLLQEGREESACRVTAKLLKKMIDQEKAQLSDIRE